MFTTSQHRHYVVVLTYLLLPVKVKSRLTLSFSLISSLSDALFLVAVSFFKWAKPRLFLFIFVLFTKKYSTNLTINDKSVNGVIGTRSQGGRMVGAE